MKLLRWLDHLLPPALMRSWAAAAGCPHEWLQEPRKVQHAARSAHESPQVPREGLRASFDDVQ